MNRSASQNLAASRPRVSRGMRHLYLFLLIALGGIALRLGWIQVWHAREYQRRPYEDRQLAEAVKTLLAQGGVLPGKYLGTVDRERLEQIVPQRGLRRQILHLDEMGLFEVEEGQVRLAPGALQIHNPRLERAGPRPGTIVDRRGAILARTRPEGRREYPLGPAAFHVIGVYSPLYERRGLESLWKTWPEETIPTTLDAQLQQEAYEQLGERRGAIVMLDVRQGDVLVCVSRPSFDPNQKPGRAWALAAKDQERQPFLNRAFQQLYPPGSTFKLITTATALQQPGFDPRTTLVCTGKRYGIEEHEPHGRVDLFSALAHSCNSYFGWLGVEMGAGSIRAMASRFGFGQSWTLAPGINAVPSVVPRVDKPYPGLHAQVAIGQYEVRATPLQMALVAQTIANGGIQVAPRLLMTEPVQVVGPVIPPSVAQMIRQMMAGVMDFGSGAWVPRIYRVVADEGIQYQIRYRNEDAQWVKVAGKTGTAETGQSEAPPHSWFIGFAPLDQPRYAIAVLVEHGGWGSVTAGPIATTLLATALARDEGKSVSLVLDGKPTHPLLE